MGHFLGARGDLEFICALLIHSLTLRERWERDPVSDRLSKERKGPALRVSPVVVTHSAAIKAKPVGLGATCFHRHCPPPFSQASFFFLNVPAIVFYVTHFEALARVGMCVTSLMLPSICFINLFDSLQFLIHPLHPVAQNDCKRKPVMRNFKSV